MKTIKILSVIVIMIFSTISVNATGIDKGNEKKIKNKISQYMEVPCIAKENNINGTVLVDISIEDDGKLKVNEINGHPRLTDYVVNQLNKIKIKQSRDLKGRSLLYKIIFK